ncbi:MAG: hypothetical protein ABR549_17950 [Mycobacteriales bacterium]
MSLGGACLLRTTRARAVRGASALLLTATLASTGLVALATPAHALEPPPVISSPTAGVTSNDRSPVVTFTGTALQYECAAAPVGDPSPAYLDCSSPWQVPTLTSDGTYSLSVREKSLLNDGTPASVDYTLDTVADLTVTPPASPDNDPRPTWGISVEPSGSASCSLDGAPAVSCTGGFTPGADLSEGSHTLDVTATDPTGNNAVPSSTSYVLDTAAPGEPTVSGASGTGNDTSPSWTWTNPDGAAALCTLTTPAGAGAETPCSSQTSFTKSVSAEGDYQLAVVLKDAAGNRSPAGTGPVYTLDTTPSAPAVFSSGPSGSGTTASVTWTFSEPGATSTCRLVGAVSGVASNGACSSPHAVTLPGDDSWTLVVTEDDGYGNTVDTTSSPYVLDTTGPDAPVVTAPSGLSNNRVPHITWAGDMPTTARCRWQSTAGGVTTDGPWTPCDTNFFDPTLPGDGSYVFQAVLTDPLGNVGQIGTSSGSYVYDGTAPSPPALTTPATPGNDTTPTVTFTPETPGGTAACTFYSGSTPLATPTWTDCTSGSYAPTLAGDGQWTLAVTLSDAAGNTSSPSTFAYLLDTSAPTAVLITGPSGPSSSRTPSWTLDGDATTTITCELLAGSPPSGSSVAGVTPCATSYPADLTGQPDGTYTLRVTSLDDAGNETVSTATYELDTTAPASPVVSGPTGTGNAVSPSWTFAVQTGTTAECRLVQGLSMSAWSDCSSGTYTVNSPADGTYTVDVLVTDLAGNPAAVASSSPYTSDRTAPAQPSVTGPSGPGNDPTPTWTWSGEAGATATCRLDRDSVIGTPTACNSGSFQPTLTGDASYVVVVQQIDAAGNPSPSTTTDAYELDTVAPTRPVVSGPSGAASTATVTWTWSAEPGATSSCVLVRDGVAAAAAACTSGTAVTLPGDGSYVLQVTVVDVAGNASPAGASPAYTLDQTPPPAPTVTTPLSPSQDRAPEFPFVSEAGTTTECRWRQQATVVRDWSSCSTPYVGDLVAMPDDDYAVDVRATDASGNTSAYGSSLGYRLDTTAPSAPVVTMPAGPSTSTTPTIAWTAEAGAAATCVLDRDGTAQPASPCSTPWQPTLSGDGAWTAAVTVQDAAGNTSLPGKAGPYVLDTTAPSEPVVTAPPSPGRDQQPVWNATLTAGDSAECSTTEGARTVSDWAACSFPLTTDLSGEPDGTYTLSVRAVDEVGLTSTAGSASYVLDTTAPDAPTVTAPSSPSQTTSPSFRFAGEAGSTATCTVTSAGKTVSGPVACSDPVAVDLSGQPDGTYTLAVELTDEAGNPGAAGTASYVLDRAAPAAAVFTAKPASPAPLTTPSWSFTAEDGATTTCTVTSSSGGAVSSGPCTSPFTASLGGDDTYTLTVTATDAAGNTGPGVSDDYVLDTAAPAPPTVTAPDSPSQSTTPSWAVSTAEGTSSCQLTSDGSVVVPWTDCSTGFSTTLTGPDGTYTLAATTTDTAGNTSAVVTSSYVLDRSAPEPALLVAPASPATGRQPVFTVTGSEPGLTATCTVNGPSAPVVGATCSAPPAGAPFTADLTGAPDGSYTLTVTVRDAAGNTADATSAPYVLDTTAPSAVLVTAPTSPAPDRVVTWTLVGDTDAALECRFQAATAFSTCPGSSGGQGSFTADLTSATDGTYVLTVRSKDAAGNLGPEVSSSYVLDTVAPAAPTGVRVGHFSPSNATAVSWTFTGDADSTALCTLLSATAIVTPERACSSPVAVDLSQQPDGTYTLSVRSADVAGNIGPASSGSYVLDRTPPAAPVITKTPGSPSPVVTPVWNVETSDPRDLLECRLVGLPGSAWAGCSDPVGYDLSPATSGSFTLQVRETDAAGNVSPVVSAPTYVLDSNAPVPPEVSPPLRSPGNSTTPVFRIAKGAGSDEALTLRCSVTRFDGLAASASPCAFGDNTVALTGIAPRVQGLVSLSVQGKDAAGNLSGTATASYLFDSIPPPSAVIRPLLSDVGTSPRVTWSFGLPPGTSALLTSDHRAHLGTTGVVFNCQLVKARVAPSFAKSTRCTSPHTELLTQTGTWTFWVWAVDAAGNLAAPASSSYTFVSPVPAVTDLRTPASGPNSHPTWTFTVPPGYSAACLLSNANNAVLAQGSCSTGRYTADLSAQPYGSYTVTVQLVNSRGDEGPFTRSTPYGYRAAGSSGPVIVVPPSRGSVTPASPAAPASTGKPHRGGPSRPTGPATSAAGLGGKHGGAKAALPVPTPGTFITTEVPKAIGNTLAEVARKPTIPLLLLAVVVGFLLLQNRIDQRDPKLASAPVGAEPELDFGPAPNIRGLEGGAPA